jgi:hypothetical protein
MENKKGAIVGCKFANSRLTLFLLGAINALPEDVKKLKDFRGNEVEPLVTVALEKIINDGDFMANEFVYHAIRELAKDPFLCDEAKAIVDRVEAKITLKTSVGYSGLRENIKAEKARIGEIKGTIGDLNGKIKAEKARIGELGKAINDEEGRKPRPDQGKIDELNREKREAEARVDRLEKAVEERKKIGGIGTAALRDLYISGDVLDSVTMAAINEFNKSTTMLTQSIAQIKTGSLAAIDSVDASEGKASFGDVAGDAVGIVSRITAKGVDRIGSAMQNMRSLGDVVVDFGFEVYQRMLDSTIAEGEKLKNDSRTFSRNAGEDLPYTRSNFVEQCKNAKAKVREEINRLVSGTLKLLNSPKNVDKDTVLAAMKHYGEQIINDLSQWLIVQTKTTPNTSGIHYDYEKIPQKPLIPLNEEDGCLLLPPNFQTTADTQVPPPPTVEEVARKPTGAQPPAAQSPKQAAPAKPVGTLKKAAGKPTEVQPPATQPPPATPTGKPTETSKTPFGLKKKVAGSSSKV